MSLGNLLLKNLSLVVILFAAAPCTSALAAAHCKAIPGDALERFSCADATAAALLRRSDTALKRIAKQFPEGAQLPLQEHQKRWQNFARKWLSAVSRNSSAPQCSSPRALLFQRTETLEKALATLQEARPKSIDFCYDDGACVTPGSGQTEMICETIILGIEGLPANIEADAVTLLGRWTAARQPLETRIKKSIVNNAPCETVSETSLSEYLRGGFATIRRRNGDNCNGQKDSEQLTTFELNSGRPLTLHDFIPPPIEFLKLLRRQKEAEILQALLRKQLLGDTSRPQIEPSECSGLPFAQLKNIEIYMTSDGLRVTKLFSKPPQELAPCQFKVEEAISIQLTSQLLRGRKNSAARGMLNFIKP